jgi:PBP1b-binding outer membrane lipoprotein LpoB
MKRIALIIILIVMTFGCSIKKKVVENTKETTETNTQTIIKEEVIGIRVPKSNISIFDQISFDADGLIIPVRRSIVDPSTNQILEYEITQKGEVKVLSITQADTITKKTTDIKQLEKKLENKETEKKSEIKAKLSIGDIISIVTVFIGGLLPAIGGGFLFIPIIIFIFIIVIIRKIFKKKEIK